MATLLPEAIAAARAAYLKKRQKAGPKAAHWAADGAASKVLRKAGLPVFGDAGAWDYATAVQNELEP